MEQNLPNPPNQNIPPQSPVLSQITENELKNKSKNSFKIALIVLVGLFLLTGVVYAGVKFLLPKVIKPMALPSLNIQPSLSPSFLPNAESPTATPSSSPEQITSDWKNYQNPIYGYSISYPGNWFNLPNKPSGRFTYFSSKNNIGGPMELGGNGVWITISVEPITEKYQTIFSKPVGVVLSDPYWITTKLEDLTINNAQAVKYVEKLGPQGASEGSAGGFTYAVKKDNLIYKMFFSAFGDKTVFPDNSPKFEAMAHSLKLLDGVWKSYKNEALNFSILYPPDWIVKEYDPQNSAVRIIGFGTKESVSGGMIWAINVYDATADTNAQINDLIKKVGNQFGSNRQEKREDDFIVGMSGLAGSKVTVTTTSDKDWYSENIFFVVYGCNRKCDKVFHIDNGAIKDSRFEEFYKSFYNMPS